MQVAIDKLPDALTLCPHLVALRCHFKDVDAYIVGGAVRDALLGRPISDLDLISPVDPTSLAKVFARQINGHWFWLDKERRQSRVVINTHDTFHSYDFALFRAPDLQRDLLDRDFTINALAIPLAGDLSVGSLIDPCNGLEDLRQNRLRMVSPASLSSDPLRILKGLRHATALCLQIDDVTRETMHSCSASLAHVAPERIRKELWLVLEDEQAARGLQLLGNCRVGDFLFGAGYTAAIPDLLTTLNCCRDSWRQLIRNNNTVSKWLSREVEQGLRHDTLLLMVFLLRNVASALPIALAKGWRLSRKSTTSISALSRLDEQVVSVLSTVAHNERAYAWWADSYHVEPKLLLLAIAVVGSKATGIVPAIIHAWVPLVNSLEKPRPADLIDGHWLNREFAIKQGPEMSKALEMVRKAEISGEVVSSDDAKEFLFRYYQNKH